ncbi:hypothetical protein [Nostoc sp. PA-18-2419]|uniref:hypothetical protein n=1 Tax=Nostoc sp. PA-18-2419 TaxID=2575443 RepID=UPI001108FD6D|nr:hypothetical protein [Nostoc sp. PA-18-2419]
MISQKIEYLVGQSLEKLYEQVFDEIHPQIKNQKRGVLSTVIYTILAPEELQAQEICNVLQIGSQAVLNDDLSISADIIGLFISNPKDQKQWLIEPLKESVKNVRKSIGSNFEDHDMKLFQIVVIGCLIVGTVSCIKYLQKTKKRQRVGESQKIQPSDTSLPQQKVIKPVALCLIVPASEVENVIENNQINVSDIEKLIDKSLYFLCTNLEDADASQQHLELTNENITTVSEQREVYIRINITDGEEMIGKKVPYILKRNLPHNGLCVVKQLACLRYLSVSGLEKFNRV